MARRGLKKGRHLFQFAKDSLVVSRYRQIPAPRPRIQAGPSRLVGFAVVRRLTQEVLAKLGTGRHRDGRDSPTHIVKTWTAREKRFRWDSRTCLKYRDAPRNRRELRGRRNSRTRPRYRDAPRNRRGLRGRRSSRMRLGYRGAPRNRRRLRAFIRWWSGSDAERRNALTQP